MKFIDRVRTQTLAILALIAVFTAITVVSPYLPHTILHAQSVGPGGVPGRSSGGSVSSVFGRTGAIVAANGDYTAAQVTNAAATNAANTFTQNQTITTSSGPTFNLAESGSGQVASFEDTEGYITLDANGGLMWVTYSNYFAVQPGNVFGWLPSAYPYSGLDTGLSRVSAGVIAIGNGNAGNTSGTIEAADLTLGGVPVTQAATEPSGSCSAVAWVLSNDGHIAFCNGTTYVSKV